MCRLLVCFSFFQFIAAHHLFAPLPEMFSSKPVVRRCISEIADRFSLDLSALPVIGFLESTIEEPAFPTRRRFESCPDTATTSALLLQTPSTVCHNESCHPVQPQKEASENDTLLLSSQSTAKKAGFGLASLMACTSYLFRPRTEARLVAADTEQSLDSPSLSPQSLKRQGSIFDKNPSVLLTVEVTETIPFASCVVMKNTSVTHDNTSGMAPGEQWTNQSSGVATSHCSVYTAQDTTDLFNKVLSELKERAAKEPFEPHVPNNRFDPPKMTKATDVLQAFFCALRHVTPIAYTITPHRRIVRLSTPKQPSGKPSVRKHRPAFSQIDDTTPFRVSAQSKHVTHRLPPKKIPYAFYSELPLLLTKDQTFIPFYPSKRFQKQNEELIEEKVLQRQHAHTKDSAPAKPSKLDKTVNQTSHLQKEPDDQDKIPQEKPQALQPFRNERSQEINCWIKRIALSTTFITLGAFLITLLKLSLF